MQIVKRILFFCLGMFILAMGINLSIQAGLGTTPVSCLPHALSLVTNIPLSWMSVIVYAAYVLVEFLILRREFKLQDLLQVPCAILFSYFIGLCGTLVAGVTPQLYWQRLLLTLGAVLCVGFGVFLYMAAEITCIPAEGLCAAIGKKIHKPYSTVKIMHDCTAAVLSAAISLIAFQSFVTVREGTVIAAVCVGLVVKLLHKLFSWLPVWIRGKAGAGVG